MDKELQDIVQRMIAAGESESNIALVIQNYKKKSLPTPPLEKPSENIVAPLDNGGAAISQSPSNSISPFDLAGNAAATPKVNPVDAVLEAKKKGEKNIAQKRDDNSILNPLSQFGKTVLINVNGKTEPRFIPLDKVTEAYPTLALNDDGKKSVIDNLQARVNNNTLIPEDLHLLTISDPQLAVNTQRLSAKEGLRLDDLIGENNLKYKADDKVNQIAFGTDDATKITSINKAIDQIQNTPEVVTTTASGLPMSPTLSAIQQDKIQELKQYRDKIATNVVLNNKNLQTNADGTQREYNDGNMLDRAKRTVVDLLGLATPVLTAALPFKMSDALLGSEYNDTRVGLKDEFFTGLEYYKTADPVLFDRVSKQVKDRLPMSQTQISAIETKGIQIQKVQADRDLVDKKKDINSYFEDRQSLATKNLADTYKHPEVLRATLASGISSAWDTTEDTTMTMGSKGLEYVPDAFIDKEGKKYAESIGLNPNAPEVIEQLQKLKDNEGWFIMQNSIAKKGITRDFVEGLGTPLRGIANSINSKSGNDAYIQGQSEGNLNVADQDVDSEKAGYLKYRKKIIEGFGEFVTQAGVAYGGGALIGGIGKAVQGGEAIAVATDAAGAAGKTIEATTAADRAIVGLDAAAESIGADAVGNKSFAEGLGKFIVNKEEFISTVGTSYLQVYDSNYKTALSYTTDDNIAHRIAQGQSLMEGLTETVLSPLDVAKGIGKNFFSTKNVTKDLLKVFTEGNLAEQKATIGTIFKNGLKGLGEAGFVAANEIGEEFVTQSTDLIANAIYNPTTFKNRNVLGEYGDVAIQTGLSMAVPAVLSGVGAAKSNTFSKSSLLFSAQAREQMIDQLNDLQAAGKINEKDFAVKKLIINTAAAQNDNLPLKNDGTKLTAKEKEDFVFNRVSQAVLEKKLENENLPNRDIEQPRIEAKIKELQSQTQKILGGEDISPAENIPVVTPAKEDLQVVADLKPTKTLSQNEIDEAKKNPTELLKMVADQAQGFNTAVDGTRTPVTVGGAQEVQAREKYGDAVVDKAMELYPVPAAVEKKNPSAGDKVMYKGEEHTVQSYFDTPTGTRSYSLLDKDGNQIVGENNKPKFVSATSITAVGSQNKEVQSNATEQTKFVPTPLKTSLTTEEVKQIMPSLTRKDQIAWVKAGKPQETLLKIANDKITAKNNADESAFVPENIPSSNTTQNENVKNSQALNEKGGSQQSGQENGQSTNEQNVQAKVQEVGQNGAAVNNAAVLFNPKESQYEALDRLTKGIAELPLSEQKAEIEKRAEAHEKSYREFAKGENKISDSNSNVQRVSEFGSLTANAMKKFMKNPADFQADSGDFANGKRKDENGVSISENDFVTLKEKVKQLRKEKNTAEIDKINAAPRAYLDSIVKRDWDKLSMQEKLALAKENLPEVGKMSDLDAVKVADQNAKLLLQKLNKSNNENAKESTNGEVVLEGVSKTGNENQGGQNSEQLRKEKEVAAAVESMDLNFVEDKSLPKISKATKNKEGVILPGKKLVPNPELVKAQKAIKEKLETLKKFVECLTI